MKVVVRGPALDMVWAVPVASHLFMKAGRLVGLDVVKHLTRDSSLERKESKTHSDEMTETNRVEKEGCGVEAGN